MSIMAAAICLVRKSLEIYKILDNPNFADIIVDSKSLFFNVLLFWLAFDRVYRNLSIPNLNHILSLERE